MQLALTLLLAAVPAPEGIAGTAITYPDTSCPARNVPIAGRKSPLDSVTFTVAGKPVKVCYGRPSARKRTMIGGRAVPFGKLWRTGANEPTIFFTPIMLYLGAVQVAPGVYSLYTVPGEREWQFIINRSISQWGHENQYTDEVRAQEVGRGLARPKNLKAPVETFTIRAQPGPAGAVNLLLEWETTQVPIRVSDKLMTPKKYGEGEKKS